MLFATKPATEKRSKLRAVLKSGRLLRFPGAFSPLVAMIERQDFDAKIDRPGRGAMDVQNTIQTFREKFRVRVHVIDLGGHHFDTGHPLSGMIIAGLAYAAQMPGRRCGLS